MADEIARLGLEINSKQIKTAIDRLDKLESQAGKTEKATTKMTSSFRGLGTAIGAIGIGLFTKKIIDNTIRQEKAVRQLEAAIESTGGAAGLTSQELQDMAASMQQVTTFGDEAVMEMQSLLLTFTKVGEETFPRASMAIADMAVRMGTDLKSATIQVGKALNDPILGVTALGRSGIQFSEDQKEMIKSLTETGRLAEAQTLILKELETQFGGSAKAARQNFGGSLEALGNAFGDLLEEDGDGLKDATSAIESLTTLMSAPETKAAFGSITSAVVKLVELSANGAVEFANFGKAIGDFAGELAFGPIEKKATQAIAIMGAQAKKVDDLNEATKQYAATLETLKSDPSVSPERIAAFESLIVAHDAVIERETRRLNLMRGINEEAEKSIALDGERAEISTAVAPVALPTELEGFEDDLEFLQAQNDAEFELQKEHRERVEQLNKESADRIRAEQERNSAFAIRLMESGNRSASALLKAALLDQAKMLGKTAVVGAYKWGAAIGGPIAGAAAAGAASIAVGTLIDAINGGGDTKAAVSGGSTVGDGGGLAPTMPESTSSEQQQQQRSVRIVNVSPDSLLDGRQLVEIMNAAADDNVKYEFA